MRAGEAAGDDFVGKMMYGIDLLMKEHENILAFTKICSRNLEPAE